MGRTDAPVFVLGLGYTGTRLALSLAGAGRQVAGTVHASPPDPRLEDASVRLLPWDLAGEAGGTESLPEGAAIVYTAPPLSGAPDRDEGARRFFEQAVRRRPRCIVYLSSTGVYAEAGGGWVEETAPVDRASPRAARRLDAERAALDAARTCHATGIVFRCAGIYGPGRHLGQRLREGRLKLYGGGKNYVNRIHVDDLVRFIQAALDVGPSLSGIYNLADDRPATLEEHALYLCRTFGLPEPEVADVSEAPSPTLLGNKRIRNDKAKATFGLSLRYPSFVEGSASLELTPPPSDAPLPGR